MNLDEHYLPSSIQFFPPGLHVMDGHGGSHKETLDASGQPTGRFEALRSKVCVPHHEILINPQACERMADSVRAAALKGTYSFIDIGHDPNKPAAVVRGVFWGGDGPMTGGIRLELVWTENGKRALLIDGHNRFSPEFEWTASKPGLFSVSEDLGGLVTYPGCKFIAPILAKSANEFVKYIRVGNRNLLYHSREIQELITKERGRPNS